MRINSEKNPRKDIIAKIKIEKALEKNGYVQKDP